MLFSDCLALRAHELLVVVLRACGISPANDAKASSNTPRLPMYPASSLRQGDAERRGVQRQEKIENGVARQRQRQCESGVARSSVRILRIHDGTYLQALRAEAADGSTQPLGVSYETVANLVSAIKGKLAVETTPELIRLSAINQLTNS